MKNIGYLRKEVAKIYNLQVAAKQCIDSRNESMLIDTMIEIEKVTSAIKGEIYSQ
jgi:hypothetical protein